MRLFVATIALAAFALTSPAHAQIYTCDPDIAAPGSNTVGYYAIITCEVSPGRLDNATGLWVEPVRDSRNVCACETEPQARACVKAAFDGGLYHHSGSAGRARYYCPVVGALTIRVESFPTE